MSQKDTNERISFAGQSSVCTGGKVSKVVTISDGSAAVVQTTAAVHNGNSGGALINK